MRAWEVHGESENETDNCHLGKIVTNVSSGAQNSKGPPCEVAFTSPTFYIRGQSRLRTHSAVGGSLAKTRGTGVKRDEKGVQGGILSGVVSSALNFGNVVVLREERRTGVARAASWRSSQERFAYRKKHNWLEESLLEKANHQP